MADLVRQALPFVAFLAFLAIFRVQARREGKTTREWLDERNRTTFSRRGPRVFFAVCVAVVAAGWIAIAVVALSRA
jgi:hypothetical protein